MILILTEVVCHKKRKTKIFNKLAKERALEFADIKNKIDPNNLVYMFKGSENKSNDFGSYQIPWKLIEDLRDGDINSKEALKIKKGSNQT